MNFHTAFKIFTGGLLFITMFATSSWGFNCQGRVVNEGGGLSCYCADGSPAKTRDLVNFYCPQAPKKAPKRDCESHHTNQNADRQKLAGAERETARLQSMLDRGTRAHNVAVKNLAVANRKADDLQRRANLEQDIQTKVSLLKEQLAIKKSALSVIRQRDKLQNTIDNLRSRLNRAKAQARAARRKVNTYRHDNSCPQIAAKKSKNLIAVENELLDKYGETRENHEDIDAVAANADYAGLALAAYKVGSEPGINGWKLLDAEKYIGEEREFSDMRFGKNTVSMYKSDNNEFVVAFQGTHGEGSSDNKWINSAEKVLDLLGDWEGNVRPGDPQARWAKNLARNLVKKYPNNNITFVGHSKGGRLARLARIETGRKAVVFNSAPLLRPLEIKREKNLEGTSSVLMGFRVSGDVASTQTAKQDIEVKNFVYGDYNTKLGIAYQAHGMEQMATAMREVQIVFAPK